MGCYTGTIFNATLLQIVSLKIVQCDITFEGRRIEVVMLKTWHYLNYKGHLYLCVQWKANASFGSLWSPLEVSRIYNWASNDAVASLLYTDMSELYLVVRFYTNVLNLH